MSETMLSEHVRGIADVTRDIRIKTGQFLMDAIEIGRLLFEAKAMVEPGGWSKYIEEELPFSHSWANNYMKLYKELGTEQLTLFGNSQAFANLRPTQALEILTLPAQEREAFLETHDVENMSTRELKKAIRERDEARKELENANGKIEDLQGELERVETAARETDSETQRYHNMLQDAEEALKKAEEAKKKAIAQLEKNLDKMEKAQAAEASAKAELKKARENPEIPESVMEQLRKEVEAEAAEKALADIQKQLSAAEAAVEEASRAKEAAERKAQETAEKLAAAEKAAKLQTPDIAVFQSLYVQLQETWNRTVGAYLKVQQADEASVANCLRALNAAIAKFQSDIAG